MTRWVLGAHGDTPPTQVAHLQGRTELLEEGNFALLLDLFAPVVLGPLWSLNLGGGLSFDLGQLDRIRGAMSKPTCTVTHLFVDPKYLPHGYRRPTSGSTLIQDAQLEADKESGNLWKNIFRALLKVNRKKYVRYLLSGNELQNGVIRRVCNVWFNPLNHEDSQNWVGG